MKFVIANVILLRVCSSFFKIDHNLVLSKMEDRCCLNAVFTKLIKRDALFCTNCQQVRMMLKSVMYRFYMFIICMS